MYEKLKAQDPLIYQAIAQELKRQQQKIELIASENFVSEAVLEAAGTVLTNKYAEGYAGKRYYGGCEFVDEVERLAIERCQKLFGVRYVNVQPHSGTQANLATYCALLQPGDRILGMDLSHGGHLSHGMAKNVSGQFFEAHFYKMADDGRIDYDEVLKIAKTVRPKVIVAGASAYSRTIDFARFREIADAVDAYLFADIAHIAGLVATGLHPSPVGHAHVITTTTHKTLRGARGGVIMTDDEALFKRINSAVFPGNQGGPLMHIIAAKAVALGEALKPSFKVYQQQILENAKAFEFTFRKRGIGMVANGTDNHLVLLDLRQTGVTGKALQEALDGVNITTNKNGVPNDPASPFVTSGLRVGTPAITTRGLVAEDVAQLGNWIADMIEDPDGARQHVLDGVASLCDRYPLYPDLVMAP